MDTKSFLRHLMDSILKVLFFAAVGVMTAVLALWTVDRSPTLQVVSAHATKPVRPGGQLEVAYRVNRFRLCDRQVFREIIDGAGFRHILGIQPNPVPNPLGFDSYTSLIAVPLTAQPGLGKYRVTVENYCNPLHYMWPIRSGVTVDIVIAVQPGQSVER